MFAQVVRKFSTAAASAASSGSTTLSNGVRVAAVGGPQAMASVGVVVDVGSSAGAPAGSAALLTSAVYSGTGSRSNVLQVRKLEQTGASVVSRVTRDSVSVGAHVLAEHAGTALSLMGDGLANCAFDLHDVADAAAALAATPVSAEQAAVDTLFETAYRFQGYGAPLVFPSGGASVDVADAEGLKAFAEAAVVPGKIVVTGVGIELDELAKAAEAAFGGLSAGNEESGSVQNVEAEYTGGEAVALAEGDAGFGILAFPSVGRKDKSKWAAAVAAQLLGDSGVLYMNNNSSLLSLVFDGVDAQGAVDTFKAAAKVEPEALDAAKARAKAYLMFQLESQTETLPFVADEFIASGSVPTKDAVAAAVDAVKPADVKAIFKNALAAPPTLTAISPSPPSYPALLKSL